MTGGVLLGGLVFSAPTDQVAHWAMATGITGMVLFVTDLYASFAIVFEVRGVAVLVKIAASFVIAARPDWGLPLALGSLVVGGIVSHMPGRFRYRKLISMAVISDTRHG